MQAQPNPILNMLPLLFIFVIFYFLLIRPQQKKQKEHEDMLKKLEKNDEIVTTGGIHGTIVNVKDTTVVLRIDDNCKVELQKSCVSHVKKKREN
ncbi:MAG: preprotein translocase subunit YajC [Candidatus Omnitrophica bacterium]|nr:preprotein translocase subunit YajC [Candidatus Omnitrophota bacterium]